ncbi:ribonuclease H [Sulfurimonas sp. MAG313]|nr:RNase H family protein [Sulfurimonas sp. MAG313]MDF1879850.1 ribonuclease H [Sulfurimonas sp. MAG313]
MIVQLFIDASVNPQKRLGFGAYLSITDEGKNNDVQLKKFEDTSSTQLELETFLWAIEDIRIKTKITIYTDCQNIIRLPSRRKKLEKSNYHTKAGTPVKHSELYKKFFLLTDKYPCTFIKLKGHKKTKLKDPIDKLFTLVDKASRDALRTYILQNSI